MMIDKRDECGCHRECSIDPHDCDKPCTWPNCLSEDEHEKLLDEVVKGQRGSRLRVNAEVGQKYLWLGCEITINEIIYRGHGAMVTVMATKNPPDSSDGYLMLPLPPDAVLIEEDQDVV